MKSQSLIETFRPWFKSLSKDGERLMEHISGLYRAGRLKKYDGVPLATTYVDPATELLIDAYFERQLYDEIERYWTYKVIAFSWPHAPILAGQQ